MDFVGEVRAGTVQRDVGVVRVRVSWVEEEDDKVDDEVEEVDPSSFSLSHLEEKDRRVGR